MPKGPDVDERSRWARGLDLAVMLPWSDLPPALKTATVLSCAPAGKLSYRQMAMWWVEVDLGADQNRKLRTIRQSKAAARSPLSLHVFANKPKVAEPRLHTTRDTVVQSSHLKVQLTN